MSKQVIVEPPGTNQLPPVRYSVTEAAIEDYRAKFTGLDPTTPDGYEETRVAIGVLRTKRGEVEAMRKTLKASSLEYGRLVDGKAKEITEALLEIEEPLKAAKAAVDAEKDRAKREAEEADRAKIAAAEKAVRDAEEAKLKAARDAEEKRLKEEAAKLAEERAKLDAERKAIIAQQTAELKRLADERAAEDARRKAEQDRIDAQRREVEAEKARLERIEFERATKERLEKEAKERAEQAERQRIEREKREREQAEAKRIAEEQRAKEEAEEAAEEAARIEAARPDVEKVNAFGVAIAELIGGAPILKDKRSRVFMDKKVKELSRIGSDCESFSAVAEMANS